MFNVFTSNRMENLVCALCELLKEPLQSSTAPELISVQSLGMRQWLSMQVAKRMGICANFEFPFPRDLIQLFYRRGLEGSLPDSDPYRAERLTWLVMALLPGMLIQSEFAPLKNYLREKDQQHGGGLRLYQLAERIADTFDQYGMYRADIIQAWDADDKTKWSVDEGNLWQPLLWKAITGALGEKHQARHAAAIAGDFIEAVEQGIPASSGLPQRVSLFSITTLPPLYVDVLAAVAKQVQVNLFQFSPSREYWANIRTKRGILREQISSAAALEEDRFDLHLEEGNALLASMGRIGKDFQEILESRVDYTEPGDNLFVEDESAAAGTILTAVQSDILRLRQGHQAAGGLCEIGPDDRSIVFHSCHTPMREVEVVRDQLRAMFDSDKQLQPHDVIVMTPDIEKYAPLIDAVFGTLDDRSRIPYAISDRSLRREAPVVEAFLALLDAAGGRASIVEVFDLLSQDAVRKRFDFSTDDIELAHHWAKEAGVRWGVDGAQREKLGQPDFEQNTWRFGLDRLLLGLALPGGERLMFGGVLPYDEVEGQDALLVGKLAEFCSLLFGQLEDLRAVRTPKEWQDTLVRLISRMLSDSEPDGFFLKRIRDVLHELVDQSGQAGFTGRIGLDVIRDYLSARFAQPSSSRGFISGGVTFCKILPMRSIPFKIVCLMGMNDGDYPRVQRRLGFDLIAGRPRPGDRSIRSDDRYQFLEALLCARQKLLITYVGQSIHDNKPIPPSVLVGELLDYLDEFPAAAESGPSDQPARDCLVIRHPMQPFSLSYFTNPRSELFSYDRDYCLAAGAARNERQSPEPFIKQALPEADKTEVRLDDLIQFFKMPAKYFLNKRLGIYLPDAAEQEPEREPLELNGLEQYDLGDWLIQRMGEKKDYHPDELRQILKAKGVLPLGNLGSAEFHQLSMQALPLAELQRRQTNVEALLALDLKIQLGDSRLGGSRLVGRIGDLWPHALVRAGYGIIDAKRMLDLWIRHLAINCSKKKSYPKNSMLIGRDAESKQPVVLKLRKIDDDPGELLGDLIDLFRLGQKEPLRFFPKTSLAYAEEYSSDFDVFLGNPLDIGKVRRNWLGGFKRPGESENVYIKRIFGHTNPLTDPNSESRMSFASLALRVFGPLKKYIGGGAA
ncbi:MAG TPA: exodeoxyribonuclease V subunit gamma [Myxococcota bacterium]|nr:exodeoxyribonuclease V subunit gamma [Myxococcota bacterium]